MKLPRRNFLHLAAGAAALPAVSRIAWTQAYPMRPITIVVPFPAGGPVDTLGRSPIFHKSRSAQCRSGIGLARVGRPLGQRVTLIAPIQFQASIKSDDHTRTKVEGRNPPTV
jgi:hypothetical protein